MSHPNDSRGSSGSYYYNSADDTPNQHGNSNRYNEYPSHRGGHSGRGYYKGAGGPGRFGSYGGESDVNDQSYSGSHQPYSYNNYRNDYYHGFRHDNNRYYNGRSNSAHQFYGQSGYRYNQSDSQYNYYGNNNRRESEEYRGGRHSGSYNPRYKSVSKASYPQENQRYSPRPQDSGNNTPVDRGHSQPRVEPSSPAQEAMVRSGSNTNIKKRVEQGESGFLYLTDLDKSTDDSAKLNKIRDVLRESEQLDKDLESHDLQLLKTELELELLTTQCERDALNVQLTQEKLDSLLMQG